MVKIDNGFCVHNLPVADFGNKNVYITNEKATKLIRLKSILEDMNVEHKFSTDKDGVDRIELKYARWPYLKFYVHYAYPPVKAELLECISDEASASAEDK